MRTIRGRDERGQALVLVALGMVMLLGMVAFVIDFGYILYAREALQSSADAAATAGALDIGVTGGNPTTKATLYSSVSGNKNAKANIPNVTMSSTLKCVNSTGLPTCTSPAVNAITVTQSATLPLYFARVLGITTKTITVKSTATMRGGGLPPLDVMIVLDTTGSMDGSCGSGTRLDCAKAGVKTLINVLWPCAQGLLSCGTVTSGNVPNPIDKVGLMVFPGLKATTPLSREFDCLSNLTQSDIAPYGSSPVYQLVPLSSDYRTSTTSILNGAVSLLAKAVDWGSGNLCLSSRYGLENPGGQGSYFAGAIAAAQSSLTANGRANVQKVIIFVSDGDATAYSGGPANPCHQAITAAQAAATAGMWVYSIAYGASTSSGSTCNDDSPSISAYSTMQQIASSPSKFFSQPSNADLTTTFQKIGSDLMNTRLVDDNAL